MMNRWQIFSMVVILLFQGCRNKNTDLEFEQDVFKQVLAQGTDSTYRDIRMYTFHCKNATQLIEKGKLFEFDDPECNRRLAFLRKDTVDLVLAVDDSVRYIAQEDQKYFFGSY